jgi:hypothetical protein
VTDSLKLGFDSAHMTRSYLRSHGRVGSTWVLWPKSSRRGPGFGPGPGDCGPRGPEGLGEDFGSGFGDGFSSLIEPTTGCTESSAAEPDVDDKADAGLSLFDPFWNEEVS